MVRTILFQERGWQAITAALENALILAVTERLGCMVLTRDGSWKWMVDEGHLEVRVAIP